MADNKAARIPGGLREGPLCLTLFAKYVVLTAYGIHAIIVEVPTLLIVAGSDFAIAWASAVTIFAALAGIGVLRTLHDRSHYRLEQWASAAFACVFVGYSAALVFRGFALKDWDSIALAWIPLALIGLPVMRYFSLVDRGRYVRRTRLPREARQ